MHSLALGSRSDLSPSCRLILPYLRRPQASDGATWFWLQATVVHDLTNNALWIRVPKGSPVSRCFGAYLIQLHAAAERSPFW